VITGFATIDNRYVAVVADDPVVLARTDGQVGKAKRRRMLKLALQEGIAIVLLVDQTADEPSAFGPMSGELFGKQADQHDDPDLTARGGPLVSVLFQPPVGQMLERVYESDVVIAVCEGGSPSVWPWADLVARDDKTALELAGRVLAMLGVASATAPLATPSQPIEDRSGILDHGIAPAGLELLHEIADPGRVIEFDRRPSCTLGTALITIASVPFAVAATGCSSSRTLASPDVSRLHRMAGLSRRWHLPLLVVQDCAGYDPSLLEDPRASRELAELVSELRASPVPIIVLVTGDGHVLGTYCLGGRQLDPALVLAWPWARVGVHDTTSYDAGLLEGRRRPDPWLAAGLGFIDEVLTPEETPAVLRWFAAMLDNGRRLPPPEKSLRWYHRGSVKGV
jgi:acetyl-CoA carboxylase carboxyltransferase component